ncbi:MAG: DoxX-like family protein, partial [Lachnospiraceae bacterium]|nr:DoxX-like family protein [Lachnospiraceae bacterium]
FLSSLEGGITELTEKVGYGVSIGGIGIVASILGLISTCVEANSIRTGAAALSTADHIGQALSVSADMIEGFNSLALYGTSVVEQFVDLGEASFNSVADTFSTVSGGITFCTGCVSVLAGGLQAGAGGVQLGRAISSRKDVKKSRERLDKKQAPLTKDQEQLRRFLDHQDRTITDQEISAGISIASGSLKMIAGAMSMTGILAPLGGALLILSGIADIGLGVLWARRRKRLTREASVDDALKVNDSMKALRALKDENGKKAREMSDKELRKLVRQDLLGALGYATYKEYFADICKENAKLLYKHVFEMPDSDPDYQMYFDALQSLGTKMVIPKNGVGDPFPTPDVIYEKLMG